MQNSKDGAVTAMIALVIFYLTFLLILCAVGAIISKMVIDGVFQCLNNTNATFGLVATTSRPIIPPIFQNGERTV